MAPEFKSLNIAVIGGGLGGLSAAISLRRAGHKITIYERHSFAGEVGAGIGIPSNGSKWLYKWGVDVDAGKPVIANKLIIHKWDSGEVMATAPLGDFKEKFRYDPLSFQRCDLHKILLDTALSKNEAGDPCKLVTSHRAVEVEAEFGKVAFENGEVITVDLIIAADGIHSRIRSAIGITPVISQASSCAYRHIISKEKIEELGLGEIRSSEVIEFWSKPGLEKVAIGGAHGGEVICVYSFFATDPTKHEKDGWDIATTPEQLVATFPILDPRIQKIMLHSKDIKIWRLYIHKPYPYWTRGRVALVGGAAHPVLPGQTQGPSQAIEDAAALGLVFSKHYFHGKSSQTLEDAIAEAFKRYAEVRMKRAAALQDASAKAREDMRERIGWASEGVKPGKLTIEDVAGYDMEAHLADIVASEAPH